MMDLPNRRSGPRWELGIHITVYGRTLDARVFYEEVKAFSVNSVGGLVLLSFPVRDGEDLLLFNNRTSREQICRVVRTRIRDERTCEVAVAFPSPNPDFWQIPEMPVELDQY